MSIPVAAPSASRKGILLGLAALAMAGFFVAIHIWGLPAKLRYPGELDFIEGIPLAEMIHLRRGVPIYAPASEQGFDATNYGPLYYLLGARLIDPERPAYLPLRVLSLVAMLGCAVAAGWMAFRLAGNWLAALLAPLLFLSYGSVIRHGASARSDMVALLLVFAGFMVAHRFRESRALLWAAPFMLVGFYYKQQFVAGPLAVLIFLLWGKRYRLAAEFTALMVLGGLAFLAVVQFVLFPGQAFLRHFVFYNVLPFAEEVFIAGIGFFAMILLVPLLASLEFLRLFPDRLLKCYLLCAFVLALLAVARAGSDTNYFLECVLVCSILFSALVGRRISEPVRAVELVVLLVVALFFGQWFRTPIPSMQNFRQDRAVQNYLRQQFPPGTLALSCCAGDMVRAGLALPFTNLYHYSQLIRKGVVSDRDMTGLLAKHHFGAVVLDFDLGKEGVNYHAEYYLTQSLRSAILQNYQLMTSIEMPAREKLSPEGRFYVWIPRLGPQGSCAQ